MATDYKYAVESDRARIAGLNHVKKLINSRREERGVR